MSPLLSRNQDLEESIKVGKILISSGGLFSIIFFSDVLLSSFIQINRLAVSFLSSGAFSNILLALVALLLFNFLLIYGLFSLWKIIDFQVPSFAVKMSRIFNILGVY